MIGEKQKSGSVVRLLNRSVEPSSSKNRCTKAKESNEHKDDNKSKDSAALSSQKDFAHNDDSEKFFDAPCDTSEDLAESKLMDATDQTLSSSVGVNGSQTASDSLECALVLEQSKETKTNSTACIDGVDSTREGTGNKIFIPNDSEDKANPDEVSVKLDNVLPSKEYVKRYSKRNGDLTFKSDSPYSDLSAEDKEAKLQKILAILTKVSNSIALAKTDPSAPVKWSRVITSPVFVPQASTSYQSASSTGYSLRRRRNNTNIAALLDDCDDNLPDVSIMPSNSSDKDDWLPAQRTTKRKKNKTSENSQFPPLFDSVKNIKNNVTLPTNSSQCQDSDDDFEIFSASKRLAQGRKECLPTTPSRQNSDPSKINMTALHNNDNNKKTTELTAFDKAVLASVSQSQPSTPTNSISNDVSQSNQDDDIEMIGRFDKSSPQLNSTPKPNSRRVVGIATPQQYIVNSSIQRCNAVPKAPPSHVSSSAWTPSTTMSPVANGSICSTSDQLDDFERILPIRPVQMKVKTPNSSK